VGLFQNLIRFPIHVVYISKQSPHSRFGSMLRWCSSVCTI